MEGDCQKVAQALELLGEAWRGDWSDFDGRTLRSQLDQLASYLDGQDHGFDVESWAYASGICPVSKGWFEHCPEREATTRYSECYHVVNYYQERLKANG